MCVSRGDKWAKTKIRRCGGKKSGVEVWGAEDNKQDLKREKDRAWGSVSKQERGFKRISMYFAR